MKESRDIERGFTFKKICLTVLGWDGPYKICGQTYNIAYAQRNTLDYLHNFYSISNRPLYPVSIQFL